LPDQDYTSLQTIKTFQTPQTREGEEKINQQKPNSEKVETNNQKNINQLKPTKQEVKEVEPTKQEVKKVEPTKEVREKDSTEQHLREQIKEQLLSLGLGGRQKATKVAVSK
jgi:hypothetical protein